MLMSSTNFSLVCHISAVPLEKLVAALRAIESLPDLFSEQWLVCISYIKCARSCCVFVPAFLFLFMLLCLCYVFVKYTILAFFALSKIIL